MRQYYMPKYKLPQNLSFPMQFIIYHIANLLGKKPEKHKKMLVQLRSDTATSYRVSYYVAYAIPCLSFTFVVTYKLSGYV